MTTAFKTRSNDELHAGLFQCDGFIGGCRRANGNGVLPVGLVQNLLRRNSIDERERRHPGIKKDAYLVFESNGFMGRERGLSSSNCVDIRGQVRQGSIESGSIGCSRFLIFHRNPQIHCEGFRRQGTYLSNPLLDGLGRKPKRSKGAEATEV